MPSNWELVSYIFIFITAIFGFITPPSGHAPLKVLNCSELTIEQYDRNFVYYFKIGKEIQSEAFSSNINNELAKVPCLATTKFKCVKKSITQNSCKRYVNNGIQWGAYQPISHPKVCSKNTDAHNNDCVVYHILPQMNILFAEYTKLWYNQIKTFTPRDSWLLDYLPVSKPEINHYNLSIQYNSMVKSQLWVSVLSLNLDEISFQNNIIHDTLDSIKTTKRTLIAPLQSNSGSWILRIKVFNQPFPTKVRILTTKTI